jgi:3-oxoacyl-[acyl-carrier protein] reductase
MAVTEITPGPIRTRPSHQGRNVLVTGAARGIGLAIARAFMERGATVGVCDVDAGDVHRACDDLNCAGLEGKAVPVACDVSSYEALDAALGACGLAFDTVINNAGISPKHDGVAHKVWELAPQEWRRVVDVNLTGSFNTIRALTPGMIAARRGWIVNMSSVAGKTYSPIVASHYAATKSAILGFTKHLAAELGPYSIRVNALAPGRIATPMVAGVAPEVNAEQVRLTPMARLGEPAEVADVALWLTSTESSFVTGQTIDVAGGLYMT